MDSLLIISKDGVCKEVNLDYGIFTIGEGPENDLRLPLSGTISFIKNKNSCYGKITVSSERMKGPWGKELKEKTLLSFEDYTFIYFPELVVQREKLKDWDPTLIPRHSTKASFPDELLVFLLGIIGADQGAILILENDRLRTVASKSIHLRDQAEIFLQRLLEENTERSVINMNYNTHTMLFKAGLSPLDFCIIQQRLSESETLVLYLPRTKNMKEIPEGMMVSVLTLSAGHLVSYLLHQKHKKLMRHKVYLEHEFFWGESEKMVSLKSYVDKLAKTNLSILIQGETGSGKEMLVKYLQKRSKASHVVSVNCAAIPKELAESVLFGHKKGSFTGATQDQIGKIQEAHNGILFLDEIGELDLGIQAKLLRALQEGVVTPVGGQESKVNIWLMTATHRNLEEMIKDGDFREDLFFRINEASVRLPSLSERIQDIPALTAFFMEEVVVKNNLSPKFFNTEVMSYLKLRKWRGNTRELKAFIRKAALLSDAEIITMNDLQSMGAVFKTEVSQDFPDDLQEAKRIFVESHIDRILQRFDGNKTHAARALGITPRNLYRLLPGQSDEMSTQ